MHSVDSVHSVYTVYVYIISHNARCLWIKIGLFRSFSSCFPLVLLSGFWHVKFRFQAAGWAIGYLLLCSLMGGSALRRYSHIYSHIYIAVYSCHPTFHDLSMFETYLWEVVAFSSSWAGCLGASRGRVAVWKLLQLQVFWSPLHLLTSVHSPSCVAHGCHGGTMDSASAHLQGILAHHTAHRTALGRFSMIQSTAGDGSTSRPVETVWFILFDLFGLFWGWQQYDAVCMSVQDLQSGKEKRQQWDNLGCIHWWELKCWICRPLWDMPAKTRTFQRGSNERRSARWKLRCSCSAKAVFFPKPPHSIRSGPATACQAPGSCDPEKGLCLP